MSTPNRYGQHAPRFPRKKRGDYDPKNDRRDGPLKRITHPDSKGKLTLSHDPSEWNNENWKWIERKRQEFEWERGQIGGSGASPHEQLRRIRQRAMENDDVLTRFYNRKREIEWRKDVEHFFADKRAHNQYVNMLFTKPTNFKTSDGKKIKVLSHGLDNIYAGQTEHAGRALVGVLVNGMRIYFYQSSGKNSGLPGKWLPAAGIYFYEKVDSGRTRMLHKGTSLRFMTVQEVGALDKLKGHPQLTMKEHFPTWVEEVSQKITALIARGKVKFGTVSGPGDIKRFQLALDFFPHLEKRGGGELPTLPE